MSHLFHIKSLNYFYSSETDVANNGPLPPPNNENSNIESTWTEIVDNFDDMNLKENLLRGIFAYGFEKPSAIQQRAIMPAVKGILNILIYSACFKNAYISTGNKFQFAFLLPSFLLFSQSLQRIFFSDKA